MVSVLIPSGMQLNGSTIVCHARHLSGRSLRVLASEAGTSHSTLSAYESGRVDPSSQTLARILAAAGLDAEVHVAVRVRVDPETGLRRGDELLAVLELAASFPTSDPGPLTMPKLAEVPAPAGVGETPAVR